jgi:hypothetical protein
MASVFFNSCFLFTLLFHSATVWAAPPGGSPPPNSSFALNFLPINTWDGPQSKVNIFVACGVGSLPIGAGSKGDQMCDDNKGGPSTYKDRYVHDGYIAGTTLYVQEVDKSSGIWHQVLIDEAENFKMDIYINMSMGSAGLGNARNMSGGFAANHVFPLDSNRQDMTGTGTGDARRVQFRMLIEEPDFKMDMVKDNWDRKPKIVQQVSGQGMRMDLIIDESNSSYSDMNTPGIVTHTTQIAGSPSFSFDSRTSGSAYVTAGRFKISGYTNPSEASDPHYVYVDAPNDFGKNMDWLSFWHGSQYWRPGDPYGYGGGDATNGDGEQTKWGP